MVVEAVAQSPTRERVGARVGWSFGWTETVSPRDLWAPLWHAINPRRNLRVRPPAAHGVTGSLQVDDSAFDAEVLDLSKGGLGVFVGASLEDLGAIGQGARASVVLSLPGDRTVKERVWVKSIERRANGTRLGLALEGLDPRATEALAAYLLEVKRDLDAAEPEDAEFA